jgi:regulator of nonsense transcripts 1
MLLLNQQLPYINRPELTGPVLAGLKHIHTLLNTTQQNAFRTSHTTQSPIVLIQGPPGTGKTVTLAMIAIGFSIRGEKVVIATPSNNAGNEACEKIASFWAPGTDPGKRPANRPPNMVRWLTPATDQSIMNNARVWGIPESMAEISMARRIQERVKQAVREGTDWEKAVAGEWLDLWKRRRVRVLKETEMSRFKELTFLWEKRCLNEAEIIVTTCDNAYTLDPEAFGASVVILDECSQATEPAALLPVERFIKTLKLVILGGDDQQLQPFVISTAAENEFQAQLWKSWFERVRLSTFVPCITLGQQYRMRPEISNIIISHFYKDKLVNDVSTSLARPIYNKYMSIAESLN